MDHFALGMIRANNDPAMLAAASATISTLGSELLNEYIVRHFLIAYYSTSSQRVSLSATGFQLALADPLRLCVVPACEFVDQCVSVGAC